MNIILPPLFIERIKTLLPENEIQAFFDQYQTEFQPSLRINSLKTDPTAFWQFFPEAGETRAVPWAKDGFFIERKSSFTKTPFYHAGLFYIQEASSMLPPVLLDPQPGEKVLDVCASPGSKTTQMIALMQNQGLLVANEFRRDRIGRLMENIIRWGARNTVITNQSSSCFTPLSEFFDKILVDAPCSGEGMFKKDPEALRCWSLQNVKTCSSVQKQILRDILPALKTGGTLVYSTCTMAPEENEEIIHWLMETYPNCLEMMPIPFGSPGITSFQGQNYRPEVSESRRMWHHRFESEGFFVAKIKKIRPTESFQKIKNAPRSGIQKPATGLIKEFFKMIPATSLGDPFQIGYRIYSWGNLPEEEIKGFLSHLKPVYLGIHLGDEKKNRIEPEHPLALAILPEELPNYPHIELNLDQAVDYLRGQELLLDTVYSKGFYLICHRNFPLGLGKYSENRLKNLFPKSLRNKL